MITDVEKSLLACRNDRDVSFFDLHSIETPTLEDLDLLFELAREFRKHKTEKTSLCKGKSQINAFFEHSTRTLSSFDLSGKHLSMDTNNVGSTSSVKKGESFLDTIETLDAYNVKIIIIRARESGVPEMMSRHTAASVVNAGDGWHEHPTQALLDGLTILDHVKQKNLEGKVITIVGDVLHSRVFGSNVRLWKKLGAQEIRVAAPETFMHEKIENFGVKKYYHIEDALPGSDIVYALRVQEERGSNGFIPSLREYSKTFGISEKRLKLANKEAIVMHPGPVIRDVDIHSIFAAVHPQTHVLKQVENGMAVRKAVLWCLAHRFDGKEKSFDRL